MTPAPLVLALVSLAVIGYAYIGYPLLLLVAGYVRRFPLRTSRDVREWPSVTITIPVYNEEAQIARTLDRVLDLDYPRDRLQVLVVSDASTDATDAIVVGYRGRGVELLRLPTRSGKTAAENRAQSLLRGEIVVNMDATIRLDRGSLRPLIAQFADPTVGVASGRDVSMSASTGDRNAGESRYVGYEMWVRELETRAGGIIGASGCFYAIRAHLHRTPLPEGLSRDFASAMIAKQHGYRAVSVPDALCFVPRSASLKQEYRRKVRTMTRGIETLLYMRQLMNPLRTGLFALMLVSHKVVRWLVPAFLVVLLVAAGWMLAEAGRGTELAVVAALAAAICIVGATSRSRGLPGVVLLLTYFVLGNLAALHAWGRVVRGDRNPIWEPTRRGTA